MEKDFEYVDLGLPSGNLWAKCNVGAEKETDYGDYFMWGSTIPDTNEKCCVERDVFGNGGSQSDDEYFKEHSNEWLDDGKLKSKYDAAHQIMGDNWYMPTKEDFEELIRETTNKWVENYNNTGINGNLFISKNNGNTLFFPASGWRVRTKIEGCGHCGYVWSANVNEKHFFIAWMLLFRSSKQDGPETSIMNTLRQYGLSVRGIKK